MTFFDHPMVRLFLDPTAGPAHFNLIAVGLYLVVSMLIILALVERRNRNLRRNCDD